MVERWKYSDLENLFSFVIGGDWGKDPSESDPDLVDVYCIRGSELKEWRKQKGATAALRKVSKSSLEKRKLQEGDILVEISGGGPDQPVGRTVLIDKEVLAFSPEIPKVCTNFFRLVRLTESVDKKFVNYFLNHFYASGQVVNYQGGSNNLRNLRFSDYAKIKVPLPPLPEQKRIVAELDTLFAHFDQLRSRLDKIPVLLKQFRQAVLTQAVTGKLTEEWRRKNPQVCVAESILNFRGHLNGNANPIFNDQMTPASKISGGWIKIRLGNLIMKGDLFDGPFGSHLKTSDYTASGVRVIRLENVGILEFIDEKESFISEQKYESLIKHTVRGGDIIISSFVADSVRATLLPTLKSKAIAKADCFCLRPIPELVNKAYLLYLLSSEDIYQILVTKVHGSTRPRINTSQLKELTISLPSLEEQKEIVRRIETLFSVVNRIQVNCESVEKQVSGFEKLALSSAFGKSCSSAN